MRGSERQGYGTIFWNVPVDDLSSRWLWRGYALLLAIRLGYFLLPCLESASSHTSLFSNFAFCFSGHQLAHLTIIDFGLPLALLLSTYKIRILSASTWKICFWAITLTDIVIHLVALAAFANSPPDIMEMVKLLPSIALMFPLYYMYIPTYFILYDHAFGLTTQRTR